MSFLYGAPAETVKARIEEAAKPLGLLKPPYQKGVSYVQDLAVDMFQSNFQDSFMRSLGRLSRLPGEPLDIEGTCGDNLLFTAGFFPEYVFGEHYQDVAKFFNYGAERFPLQSRHKRENQQTEIETAIKRCYTISPNPFVKEKREVIAYQLPAYIACMQQARVRFWEDNPNVAESINRLLIAKTQGEQEMDLSRRIALITQTDIGLWDGMLKSADYRSDN